MDDKDDGLTEAEYNAGVARLGLRPTAIKTEDHTIHSTVDGDAISVPHGDRLTMHGRKEALDRLKLRLGIGIWPTLH